MINFAGLIYQSRFIAELNNLHVINDEVYITKHAVLPDCWCFVSQNTGRTFQLKLVFDGEGCEIGYISPEGKHLTLGIYDAEKVAERAINYLRKYTDKI